MKFDAAVSFVLDHEGGYSNDPNDPGGETNYGISKRSYPSLDIKKLTREQAIEIYRTDYWQKSGASQMDERFRLVHFDTAVNCGVSKAKEIKDNVHAYLEEYLWLRAQHYIKLVKKKPSMKKYLNGWMNRLNDLYEYEMR
ncbi:MAG: glycosyl hydrolase 108 family protein [Candidatus Marinimicrobia bacterium]|nr:glycosyl hydrolase 108 family protein [Candidatus Neomarinimicrobiota bacterium]